MDEKFIPWRGSVSDLVTDLIDAVGRERAVHVAREIHYRLGDPPFATARDREAAIGWAYGKPSSEMDKAIRAFVETGAGDASIPPEIGRLATSVARMREALARTEGK